MSTNPAPTVLQRLRRALGHSESAATDAQLLTRFLARRDHEAFELLVWRHERLVLSACRRILGDLHDAEDAFQATFLTLVRKAATIGRGQALASWLYRVACRIALRARAGLAVRAGRERQGTDLAGLTAADDAARERRELGPVLDEEIGRLPEKYRAAVVLCYLEGRTYGEAARVLGCPVGTVSTRLTHARELLRARLTRRGVGLGAGALAAILCECAASAAVPAALVSATVEAAARVAAGQAAAAVVSPRVAALTEGALRAMWITKLKIAATLLLAVGVLGGAVTLSLRAGPAGQEQKPAPRGKQTDEEKLQGKWKAVSFHAEGKEGLPEQVGSLEFTFKGDKVTIRVTITNRFHSEEMSYRLDATKKPKTIDLAGERPGAGIYKFEGERLVVAVAENGGPRPGDFEPGPKRMVVVLERVKSGAGTAPAPKKNEAQLRQEVKADRDRLQGSWVARSIHNEGEEVPAEQVGTVRFTFKADQVTLGSLLESRELPYQLDPAQKPKAIDFRGDDPATGIYQLEGDRLVLAFNPTGQSRPMDFKPGPERTVFVLERVKAPAKTKEEAQLRNEVQALREAYDKLRANYETLREELSRRIKAREESEGRIEGVLKAVDVEKNTLSLTLGKTKLLLANVPMAVRVKFFLGLRECTINDLKPGMEARLQVETNGDRTEVVHIEAGPARKE
jgi:RNA polymerase sigma factor (sigma-70 family)